MTLLARLIPSLVATTTIAAFESIFAFPKLTFVFLIIAVIFAVGGSLVVTGGHIRDANFRRFAILLSATILVGATFALFLETVLFKHALALFLGFAFWLFLTNLRTFTYSPLRYQPYALENLTSDFSLGVVFLGVVSIFNFQLFFDTSWPILFAFSILIISGSAWLTFSISKFFPLGRPYFFVITLVSLEVTIAVAFLPVSTLVKGAVVAISYYLCVELSRAVLRKERLRDELRRPLLLASSLLVIVLLTARWT